MIAARPWIASILMLAGSPVALAHSDEGHGHPVEAFSPPSDPVILTRTLQRPLPGGEQIAVTRRYVIRFLRDEAGFTVEGQLLDVAVDAPPQLARLAEIERTRPDSFLFPTRLDSGGKILDPSELASDPIALTRALAGAAEALDESRLGPTDREELSKAVRTVGAAAAISLWPTLLFNPGSNERVTRQTVTLSDGAKGHVEVRIRADSVTAGGLPGRVERSVTTRIGNSARVTHEIWTFTSAN